MVKGRIYVTAGFRRDVVCLDAGTGELLWMHTYDEGDAHGQRAAAPAWASATGPTAPTNASIYVTRGYTMFSLDAKTGLPRSGLRHQRHGRPAPE